MSEPNKKTIRERVLEAIKTGRVKMRPKWQFAAAAILFVAAGVLLALTILYLVSFIIFTTRQTGVSFVPLFGLRGWLVFFLSLPWLLILLSVIFVIVLELLMLRYSFAYRRPLLYSALAILALALVGGLLLARTSLHRRLFHAAQQHHLLFGEGLYQQFGGQQFGNIRPGKITELTANGFVMTDRRGQVVTVMITPQTRLPFDKEFSVGDVVVVFGDQATSTVEALGVRKVGDRSRNIDDF